jgi:hypothetical protein
MVESVDKRFAWKRKYVIDLYPFVLCLAWLSVYEM